MKVCPSCGFSNADDAKYCSNCATPLLVSGEESTSKPETSPVEKSPDMPAADNYEQQSSASQPVEPNASVNQPVYVVVNSEQSAKQPGSGFAGWSLAIGIITVISVACLCLPVLYTIGVNSVTLFIYFGRYLLVCIAFDILGLVLASIAKGKGNKSGTRTAGSVLSLIALIIGVLELLFMMLLVFA